jgi:hypothetical protein
VRNIGGRFIAVYGYLTARHHVTSLIKRCTYIK